MRIPRFRSGPLFWACGATILFALRYQAAADPTVTIDQSTRSVRVVTSERTVCVQPWSSGSIRIQAAPGSALPEKQSFAVIAQPISQGWTVAETSGEVRLVGLRLQASVDKTTGLVAFYDRAGAPLLRQQAWSFQPAQDGKRNGLETRAIFARSPEERFYGAGVVGSELRQGTAHIVMANANARVRIPVLYSSRGYALFWDNPSPGALDLSPDSVTWSSSAGDGADFYVMAGPEADQTVAEYRTLTGVVPLFPRWAYGFWFSRDKFTSQKEILQAAGDFRAHAFPIDLIVQDFFYWLPRLNDPASTNWGSHVFERERYPDPKAMVDELHDRDHLHFMVVVWPKFNPDTHHAKELAAVGGLFPAAGDWAGPTLQLYDPFNVKAREIYGRQVMQSLLPLGVDAFWMDAAEPETHHPEKIAALDSAAGPMSRVSNAYPLVHADAVYTAHRAATDKRAVLLPRSAWAGEQRYAACNWTGDIAQDWKTLSWQIEGLPNYSVTGLPYITTDVGGYFSPGPALDPELFVRWFQWGTFCPIYRVHGQKRAFPWQYGSEAEAILQKFAALRYRLLPYIYTQAAAVTMGNGTLMRPLVMDFRDDAKALEAWDEFMFGPSILVCPVHEKEQTKRDVYLPKGNWYNFWTGQPFTGGQTHEADAPLNTMPLYVRSGAIVPFGPDQQYVGEKPAGPIELRVYRGTNASFDLYEDEGDGYGYEKGAFATIPISWDEAKETLTFSARRGSFPGMAAKQIFSVVWIGPKEGVTADGVGQYHREVIYDGQPAAVQSEDQTSPEPK